MEETENIYSVKTLNGNWYERKYLRQELDSEAQQKPAQLKKHSLALYTKKEQTRMKLSNLKTLPTFFDSPDVLENDRFTLTQKDANLNLTADLSKPQNEAEFGVFAEQGKPVLKSTFSFQRVDFKNQTNFQNLQNSKKNGNSPLCGGETVFVVIETPFGEGEVLYLSSRMRTHVSYSEGADDRTNPPARVDIVSLGDDLP